MDLKEELRKSKEENENLKKELLEKVEVQKIPPDD